MMVPRGVCGHAGLEAAISDDLVLGPDSDGKGAGSIAQHGIGSIVEGMERWDSAAATNPDEAGGEQLGWQLAEQLGAGIVLDREKVGACKVFE